MKKKVYRVRTQYIFNGVFDVVAESKGRRTAESPAKLWAGIGGSIHSTLPDDETKLGLLTDIPTNE